MNIRSRMGTLLKRFIKLIVFLLVLSVGGYLLYSTGTIEMALNYISPEETNGSLKELKTVKIKRGDLRVTVAATGRVKPDLEVVVKSKASGDIVAFPFEAGDLIKRGEVIVRLDPAVERSRVNQSKANLIKAVAMLEKARLSRKDARIRFERKRRLFADRIISRQDIDSVQIEYEKSISDIKIADAEVMRLREALKEAEDRLKDTEITAPLSGTILEKFVEEGQVITSGTSSTTEGTSLFNMADLNKMFITVSVDETDVGKIQPGHEVSITVDAYLGWFFKGKVIRIAPKGRIESTITVFDVTVEVRDKEKSKLKPLMTANVEILTDLRRGVLLVPSEAVKAREDEFGVYVKKNDEPAWVSIKTGESDGTNTEVEGDIQEGAEVVVSGIESRGMSRSRKESLKAWGLRRILRGGKR